MGDIEEEVPKGKCQFCGTETIYHTLVVCRECLRTKGDSSYSITKNTLDYWNWKLRNDYLSKKEKETVRNKIKEVTRLL